MLGRGGVDVIITLWGFEEKIKPSVWLLLNDIPLSELHVDHAKNKAAAKLRRWQFGDTRLSLDS